jgi:transposase InsO family protein
VRASGFSARTRASPDARDHDSKFGGEFDRVAKGAGIRFLKTAVRTPLMNATCERFLDSVRRECLDHFIILGEHHLRSVLDEYSSQQFQVPCAVLVATFRSP